METLVDLDYLVKQPEMRGFWDAVETTEFALQPQIEQTARTLYEGKNYHGEDRYFADWFLTRYSQSLALDAYYKALGFIEEFEP